MQLAKLAFPIPSFENVLYVSAAILVVGVVLNALFVMSTSGKRSGGTQRSWLSRLIYIAYLACVVLLAVTAFGSIIRFGHMSGYALLLHVAGAGAFVFLLLAIAWLYLPRGPASEALPADHRWWLARCSAWWLVISSIVAAGTMFLSMLPILDTPGLLQVAELHRYAGLAVVAAAIVHLYALACTRCGWR